MMRNHITPVRMAKTKKTQNSTTTKKPITTDGKDVEKR
jgi:hypothetical protein